MTTGDTLLHGYLLCTRNPRPGTSIPRYHTNPPPPTVRYLAAYLLLQTGGNASPSKEDIKSVLDAAGCVCNHKLLLSVYIKSLHLFLQFNSVETDEERLSKLLSELEGKDVNELIQEGSSKLASVPSGGGGGAAPAAAAGGAAPAEEKKEEKKEEEKEG